MSEDTTPPETASVKVLVTGPFGAGTTTFIRTLSEINVLTTERHLHLHSQTGGQADDQATVAMDFGRLTIDDSLQLYLFGTPGHHNFDFVWDIMEDGLLGFIVIVDNHRPDSFDEVQETLSYLAGRADVAYVVGVNKVPVEEEERAVRHARHLLRLPDAVPVVVLDARDRESAKSTLLTLFRAVQTRRTSVTGPAAEAGT